MASAELNRDCLCCNIKDFTCAVTACSGEAHVVLGKSEIHDGVVMGTDVDVDFCVCHVAAFSRVKQAHIALLVSNGCDGGIMAAGQAEGDCISLAGV